MRRSWRSPGALSDQEGTRPGVRLLTRDLPVKTTTSTSDGATRHIIIAITLLALAVLAWQVADIFMMAFGGVVFAAVLRGLADPLSRRTKVGPRWCVVGVLFGLMVAGGGMFWLFGRQAMKQFSELAERLPEAFEKFTTWLSGLEYGQVMIDSINQAAEAGNPLTSAGLALGAAAGGVAHLLLILVVGIYFAIDPAMYRDGALRLIPPARRPTVREALNDAGIDLRKWLIAQLIIMAAVGALTAIGLASLGVPLWLSLALLAGVLDFVPVVGPIVAAIPAILIAFSVGPETALYVLLVYIAVQQIESNLLTPVIQRWAVQLPPVVALLSIVAFGLLFGIKGVIFATPLAVVVVAMVRYLYVEDTLEKGKPGEAHTSVATGRNRSPDKTPP